MLSRWSIAQADEEMMPQTSAHHARARAQLGLAREHLWVVEYVADGRSLAPQRLRDSVAWRKVAEQADQQSACEKYSRRHGAGR